MTNVNGWDLVYVFIGNLWCQANAAPIYVGPLELLLYSILLPLGIGALKYLEIKIKEWPSRVKWGQMAKRCQTGLNRA